MRSKGFKAKFMMAFWGLFVEAHYIAANNDTMEGSQGILPFIILLIVSICVIAFLSYYMKAKRSGGCAVSGRIFLFQSVFSPKTFSLSRLYNGYRRQRKQATDGKVRRKI